MVTSNWNLVRIYSQTDREFIRQTAVNHSKNVVDPKYTSALIYSYPNYRTSVEISVAKYNIKN